MRIFTLIAVFISTSALAQGNVEINLDALEGYTPPPMFEEAEPGPLTPDPPPAPVVAKTVNVPIPAKKPAITRTVKQATTEIEDQIVLQTAQDILRQIEGKPPLPKPSVEVEEVKALAPPPPMPEPVIPVKNKITLDENGRFEVVLPFTPGEEALSKEHQSILSQQIVLRMQKYENVRLDVRAFASSADAQESPSRRLSLVRALAVRNFLSSKDISKENIYLRPLGRSNTPNSDYIQLTLSQI